MPTLRITTRQTTLAIITAVRAPSAAAGATKPPPAPVEPAPLVKKGCIDERSPAESDGSDLKPGLRARSGRPVN